MRRSTLKRRDTTSRRILDAISYFHERGEGKPLFRGRCGSARRASRLYGPMGAGTMGAQLRAERCKVRLYRSLTSAGSARSRVCGLLVRSRAWGVTVQDCAGDGSAWSCTVAAAVRSYACTSHLCRAVRDEQGQGPGVGPSGASTI